MTAQNNEPAEVKSGNEEIAIIGMGCRYPKSISTPEEFWQSLLNRVDGISDVPSRRWDIRKYYDENKAKPGKMYVKQAGFIDQDLEEYDPLFFGISPRDADVVDPMQRLLMEVAWEALEHAGITTEQLKNLVTGVFVGGFALDNKVLQLDSDNQYIINPSSAVGITLALLSNRLSYVFDLTGPSFSVDTACSSSMVATHCAVQSLRNGDCDMALVGGGNTMFTPGYPIAMCKGQFLSDHGRCKAFSNDAAGYVRAEGAGIFLLKRLEKAKQDGDVIHAVIVESGVNQDGGQTNGISQPNAKSQEALIRQVYRRAGVSPKDLSYIEAHGTGTKAGDPIELSAITAAMEDRDPADTCYVGSVKTNIGHMEASSAVAGIMKASLAAKHKLIPANLHFNTPNENIPFDEIPLKVPTDEIPLDKAKTHYIGVNSFGYGGTNGHVLLRSPQGDEITQYVKKEERAGPWLVPISAKSKQALVDIAQRYYDFVEADLHSDSPWVMEDLIYSLSLRRSHHAHRLVLIVEDKQDLLAKLASVVKGEMTPEVVTGKANSQDKKRCMVFSGMGPQWWKMGQELYQNNAIYRAEVDKIDDVFKAVNGWSILDEMMKSEDESDMASTTIAQPANFVIQIGLAKIYEYWGIKPDCVVGHSVGEVSSAYLAGALTLEEAVLVSRVRSEQQKRCAGSGGAMLAVGLSEAEAIALIEPYRNVDVGAINSNSAVTLSGSIEELQQLAEKLDQEEVFNRFLKVEIAYHSYQMEPILGELTDKLANLSPQDTHLPLYSTVTGQLIEGTELDATYWCQNVRQPVRFITAIETIVGDGDFDFIEVGPHPVLHNSIKECLTEQGLTSSVVISTLNRKIPEESAINQALAKIHCSGIAMDWSRFFPQGGQFIDLPLYPWQREHYWHETEVSMEKRLGRAGYIYLNELERAPTPAWNMEVNRYLLPYLEDHKVEGMVVFPGAGFIDIALALHDEHYNNTACTLENVEIHKMLVVHPEQVPVVRSWIDPELCQFNIYSHDKAALKDSWNLHATGSLITGNLKSSAPELDLSAIKKQATESMSVEEFYADMRRRGLDYGECFQSIKSIAKTADSVLAYIEPNEGLVTGERDYVLHPTILDASFQSLITLLGADQAFVPVSLKRMDFYRAPRKNCWSYAHITHWSERAITCHIQLVDERGKVLAEIHDLVCSAINNGSEEEAEDRWLYDYQWEPSALVEGDVGIKSDDQFLVLAKDDELSNQVIQKLDSAGANYVVIREAAKYKKVGINLIEIDPESESQLEKALAFFSYMNVTNVVDLWSANIPNNQTFDTELLIAEAMKFQRALALVTPRYQAIEWLRFSTQAQVDLRVGQSQNIALSPLLGLAPLVVNEFANTVCRSIDLEDGPVDAQATCVLAEIIVDDRETEVAYKDGQRWLRRLIREPADMSATQQKVMSSDEPIVLAGTDETGTRFNAKARQEPKANEVEIEVTTAIVDETKSYINTDSRYFGNQTSYVVYGRVVSVGEDSPFAHGDWVVALSPTEGITSYLTVSSDYVVTTSATLAGGIAPYTFARHIIDKLQLLKPGQPLLINGADCPLGMALMQTAIADKHPVWVTAAAANIDRLSALNIEKIYDNSTLDFIDDIASDLPLGLGAIVNLSSGLARDKSFELLSEFGAFIDVKTDQSDSESRLPTAFFERNGQYVSVDIGKWLSSRPDEVRGSMDDAQSLLIAHEDFLAPPLQYPISEMESALAQERSFDTALMLNMKDQQLTVEVEKNHSWLPRNSALLITGGTKGFGFSVAQWLSELGAEKLILVSRSGVDDEATNNAIAKMVAQGTHVVVEQADMSVFDDVATLIEKYDLEVCPLKGVFHCAGVLDDAPMLEMSPERFRKVVKPKVDGAWNLHNACNALKHSTLDLFVMFSSVSSMVGNANQSNYVLANTFFDHFTYLRRALGLPGISINWGALAETGMVARSQMVADILASQGIMPIETRYALAQMDDALEAGRAQVGILDVDWNRWFAANDNAMNSPRYQHIIATLDKSDQAGEADVFVQSLTELSAPERHTTVEEAIKKEISELLRIPVEQIDSDSGLSSIGVDSLITSELSLRLKREYRMKVNSVMLLNTPSIKQLAIKATADIFTVPEPDTVAVSA